MEKPTSAAIGQRWLYCGSVYVVTELHDTKGSICGFLHDGEHVHIKREDGNETWERVSVLLDGTYTYKGMKQTVERDWTPWIPPVGKEVTGASFTRRKGQIVALCLKEYRQVLLVETDEDCFRGCGVRILAGYRGGLDEVWESSTSRVSMLLIQDVGQAEPFSPEQLYGETAERDLRMTMCGCWSCDNFPSKQCQRGCGHDGSCGAWQMANPVPAKQSGPAQVGATTAVKAPMKPRCGERHSGYGLTCKEVSGHEGDHRNGEAEWVGVTKVKLFRAPLPPQVCLVHGSTCSRPKAEGARLCEDGVRGRTSFDPDRVAKLEARVEERSKQQAHPFLVGGIISLRE